MSDEKINSSPRRRGWLRKLAWVLGVFVVLLVVAYFVLTSGAFVKGVVLPKVGAGMNADLTAADVSLSPFSQLVLRDVKLTPKGAETLFTANVVRTRYSLFSIIGGNIKVEEATVESPVITIVQNADGTSNLDPLTKAKPEEKKEAKAKVSEPPKVDIKLVAVKNGTVKQTKVSKEGGRETLELSNVNFNLTDLKNGGSAKMDMSAGIAMENTAATNAGALQATLGGNFTFDMSPDLKPGKVNGKANFDVTKATGGFAQFAALKTTVDADATPTEIKQFAMHFTQAGQPLGEIRASGPFDATKSEGKLTVIVAGLDKRVLNLAGAASGIDFGTTTINSTNLVELANGGKMITASGQLDAAKMRITKDGQSTPTLDLRGDYAVTVDNAAQSAQLRTLNLTGTQEGKPLLKTELTSPMTISYGGTSAGAGEATLNITLVNLNLADWRAFAADVSPAGTMNATAKLNSQQGGKILNFDVDGKIAGLSAQLGENAIKQSDVTIRMRGTGTDMKQFKLTEYATELAQGGQSAFTLSGSGTFDTETKNADLQIVLRATLAKLLAMFPQPDAKFSNGTIDLTGHVTTKDKAQAVTGKLTVANVTGNYGDYRFSDYGTTADIDVAMKESALEIRKASGELRQGANSGGKFDVAGNLDTAKKSGRLTFKLSDFNQNGLRPFLESALGDKKLVSVGVNSTAEAAFQANGDATVKGDLQVSNLVVNDPSGAVPATPLEAKAQVDAGLSKQVAQIRKGRFELTPTERAKVNDLNLAGTVDYSKSNAISGNLKIASDALDVTRYYELFYGKKPAATSKPSPAPTRTPSEPTPAPSEQKEPDAIKLPVERFTGEINIGRFYVSEVEITNLQTTALIEGSHVILKPCQLVLNGAPVNANVDLDLGVPGYKYAVTFTADKVPLAPVVNTFMPDQKGKVGGHLTGNANVKGAGTTGKNLKETLSGNFDLGSTNLNLSADNLKGWGGRLIKTVVKVVTVLPELAKNPEGGASSLVSNFLNRNQAPTDGSMADVAKSPINIIQARGNIGSGKINLERAFLESPSFQSDAVGTVTIADVFESSPVNIPLNISLQRDIAERLKILAADTPTNAIFAKLPSYVTLEGPIGDAKPKYNTKAIVGTVVQSVGGFLGRQSTNASATSATPSNVQASGTNQPATNAQPAQPTAVDIIRGVGDLFNKKPKATPTNPK